MIGIDEVGRGCWAGPLLVVAARMVTGLPSGLADSKILTRKKRESLFHDISLACDIGEGWVNASEIDGLGLTRAMQLAVERALLSLRALPNEEIIMDGNINYCSTKFIDVKAIIRADAGYPVVSAASIYAKVLRDQYMSEQAKKYPAYSFEKHVGYGTAAHIAALKLHGICELHRLSYKPVRAILLDLRKAPQNPEPPRTDAEAVLSAGEVA